MDMRRVRVKVSGSGTQEDPFHVDLPTCVMIPGTEKYDPKDKGRLVSVEVLVPADEVDEKGNLSVEKIRCKYRGQPKWDRPDLKLPK